MAAAKKAKGVDVRKPADRKALKDIIDKHPITIILIHADWCGHCQRYKENVWNKLETLPSKKNGLAAIHHDQLEGTEFADAKLKGYPSVIVVGKKKMAEFEDDDGLTNAIPTDQANDLEKMQTLVNSAEPSTLTGTLQNIKTNVDESLDDKSPKLSQEAITSREQRGYTNLKSRNGNKSVPTLDIPDPTKDTLDTQQPATTSETIDFEAKKQAGGSGSLYESLLAATRAVAPAAALVATAVALKRRSRSRKSKRSGTKRSGTKRSGTKRSGTKRSGTRR